MGLYETKYKSPTSTIRYLQHLYALAEFINFMNDYVMRLVIAQYMIHFDDKMITGVGVLRLVASW